MPGASRNHPTQTSETESALYGALMSLRSLGQSTTAPASAKADAAPKQKAARMAEWSQLPLKDRPDMERWLTAMSDQFTTEPPRGMAPDSSGDASIISMGASHDKLSSLGPEPPSGGGSSAWQPMDSRVDSGSPYDAHRSHPGMMASPIYFGHQVAAGTEALPNSTASNSQGEMIIDNDAVSVSVDANAFGRAEVRTGRSRKAEELSHTNSSIYF
ncbi:hypothetical protein N7475_003996 [Penicillium sp. IBT 31633x]|nr:hypothetical protein N7475_003996 [Penicillium sp. IBT 31633x]